MNDILSTSIGLDPQTAADVQKLRKSMEDILLVSLIGFVVPIVFPCMIALGTVYALRRRKILKNTQVKAWISDRSAVDLKKLAKQPTVEGGVARIAISAWRPWIPMILPVVAVGLAMVLFHFMGV